MAVKRGFREGQKAPSGKIVDRLRVALDRGIDELDRRGKPLHMMIADGFEKDPARMITAIRSILPQDIKHTVLDVTQLHLQAVRDLSRSQALPSPTEEPVVIDVSPVDTLAPQNNVTRPDRAGEGTKAVVKTED